MNSRGARARLDSGRDGRNRRNARLWVATSQRVNLAADAARPSRGRGARFTGVGFRFIIGIAVLFLAASRLLRRRDWTAFFIGLEKLDCVRLSFPLPLFRCCYSIRSASLECLKGLWRNSPSRPTTVHPADVDGPQFAVANPRQHDMLANAKALANVADRYARYRYSSGCPLGNGKPAASAERVAYLGDHRARDSSPTGEPIRFRQRAVLEQTADAPKVGAEHVGEFAGGKDGVRFHKNSRIVFVVTTRSILRPEHLSQRRIRVSRSINRPRNGSPLDRA